MQAEIVTSNEKVGMVAEFLTYFDMAGLVTLQEIIVKTAEDPNGRLVLGPNEPIFLRT